MLIPDGIVKSNVYMTVYTIYITLMAINDIDLGCCKHLHGIQLLAD